MKNYYSKASSFLLFIVCLGSQVCAQQIAKNRPIATATKLEQAPLIDGEVQNEEVWKNIEPIRKLIQNQPNSGAPASEETEIRIAYTPSTLYIGVVCFDSDPENLVVSDARRDASLDNTDAFSFLLDTYHDRQNGFIFGTNPLGIEYDAQVTNEGQGNFSQNRQTQGVIGGFNLNWDAAWQVKVDVGDYGWSAEFAIPFRTLRFLSGEDQVWGLNFRRNIRKTNEIAYWADLPLNFTLNRVSLAGELKGLDVKNPGNLKVIPYVLGQLSRDYTKQGSKWDTRPDIGGDIKYSVTPSLTLDLTYNTDFAQVEVDDQQINLDRFNLFFPEKRPFFLENAGQFAVGSPGEVDLFFSRRIGIGENGQLVPIIGGGRLSGRVGKTNLGLLSMFTEEVNIIEDSIFVQANNFSVARVSHEFAERSAIGGAYVSRQGMSGIEDDFNRAYAIDGRWGIGKKAQVSGFYARTQTPGITEGNHSFRLLSQYQWNGLILSGAYTEVGEGFNPEVGFLLRSAYRKPEFLIFQNIRSKNGKFGFLEFRPHVSYRGYWDFDGFQQTGFLHIDNHWVWKSGFEVHTGVNITQEGLKQDFEITDGVVIPAGEYNHEEIQFVAFSNASKPLSFRLFTIAGGFFGGKRLLNSFSTNVRIGDKFNTELALIRNDINLPGGKFNTNIFRGRISYAFTPLIFAQGLIQYNNVQDLWSANLRFGWLQRANSGLFIVYNETRDTAGLGIRSLTLKYSHVLDAIR